MCHLMPGVLAESCNFALSFLETLKSESEVVIGACCCWRLNNVMISTIFSNAAIACLSYEDVKLG